MDLVTLMISFALLISGFGLGIMATTLVMVRTIDTYSNVE